MNAFVLDCSVTMAWCFQDEFNSYAAAVQDSFQHSNAVVPAIWVYEVANVLCVGERRNRLTDDDSSEYCALLSRLPIEIAPSSPVDGITGLRLVARNSGLSAYDAAYIALAKDKSLPLATLDSSMIAAAQKLGVQIFNPVLSDKAEDEQKRETFQPE